MALYVEGADAAKAVQRLTSMGLPPAAVTIIVQVHRPSAALLRVPALPLLSQVMTSDVLPRVQAQADGSLKTETLRLPSLSWIGPPLPPGPVSEA